MASWKSKKAQRTLLLPWLGMMKTRGLERLVGRLLAETVRTSLAVAREACRADW